MEAKAKILEDMKEKTLREFPKVKIDLNIIESYRNMNSILSKYSEVMKFAEEAMKRADVRPVNLPIRGGTDGSKLTFMGLPTPNIFAGEENPHGKLEWISDKSMVKAVETIVNLCNIWAEKGAGK